MASLTAQHPAILALVARPELCRGCQECMLACSLYHEDECNIRLARLRVLKDMGAYRFQIIICRQCADPACLAACPSGALRLNAWGIPAIVDEECSRCGACQAACPYDALFYHAASDHYLKCDSCAGRAEGPLCAQVCPVRALTVERTEVT